MKSEQHCPSCGDRAVSPVGHSDYLIIGTSPERIDMMSGKPFSTSPKFMTAGGVLKKELQRVGLSLHEFRVMNLWMHEPNKNENCFQAGYEQVLEEAKGKQAVLLVGADVVSTFTEFKVSDVNGLRVESPFLSCPNIMACVSPALALHRGFGEVRFAIEQWAEMLESLDE